MRDFVRHLLLPLRARGRVMTDGAIELLIAAHGILEHADRACQCADFVPAIAERYGDGAVAAGNSLRNACDVGDRPGHAACDDRHARQRQRDRNACSAVSKGGMIDAFVDLCADLTGRIAVVQAQRCQILAERAANFSRLILSDHSRAAWAPCL